MHVEFEKPVLDLIHDAIAAAEIKGQAIKRIVLTGSEWKQLESEIHSYMRPEVGYIRYIDGVKIEMEELKCK
jgi:hypothetical protein